MNRHLFYEIPSEAYLYRSDEQKNNVKAELEEPVRQWCAFELIRAYGIAIDRLSFEHKVRVGSKYYRIDILILKEGTPWAVVECKKSKFQKHDQALEQARSYATAEGVNVDYVVYTNGKRWLVEHRVDGDWVRISDLPSQSISHAGPDIVPLLRAHKYLGALLHKLNEEPSGAEASQFLLVLQSFFNSRNLLLDFSHKDLVYGLDLLLRSVFKPDMHMDYRCQKLGAAIQCFERFRLDTGLAGEIFSKEHPKYFHEDLRAIATTFSLQVDCEPDLNGDARQLMLLGSSIARYGGNKATRKSKLPAIPRELMLNLKAYLNRVCTAHLDLSLPDYNDKISWGDIHELTHSFWSDAIK